MYGNRLIQRRPGKTTTCHLVLGGTGRWGSHRYGGLGWIQHHDDAAATRTVKYQSLTVMCIYSFRFHIRHK